MGFPTAILEFLTKRHNQPAEKGNHSDMNLLLGQHPHSSPYSFLFSYLLQEQGVIAHARLPQAWMCGLKVMGMSRCSSSQIGLRLIFNFKLESQREVYADNSECCAHSDSTCSRYTVCVSSCQCYS